MKVILDTDIWISFLLGKIDFQSVLNLFELINAKCQVIEGYKDAESGIRDIMSSIGNYIKKERRLVIRRFNAFYEPSSYPKPENNLYLPKAHTRAENGLSRDGRQYLTTTSVNEMQSDSLMGFPAQDSSAVSRS